MLLCREENLAKIARRIKEYKVEELNPPREGKRLLVLDVDYTLFGETSRARLVDRHVISHVNLFTYSYLHNLCKVHYYSVIMLTFAMTYFLSPLHMNFCIALTHVLLYSCLFSLFVLEQNKNMSKANLT